MKKTGPTNFGASGSLSAASLTIGRPWTSRTTGSAWLPVEVRHMAAIVKARAEKTRTKAVWLLQTLGILTGLTLLVGCTRSTELAKSAAASESESPAIRPTPAPLPDQRLGLTLAVPSAWQPVSTPSGHWLWAHPGRPQARLGLNWTAAPLPLGWQPTDLLPCQAEIIRALPVTLPWGPTATRYTVKHTTPAAQGGEATYGTHVVGGGQRAYDFYLVAPSLESLAQHEPVLQDILASVTPVTD